MKYIVAVSGGVDSVVLLDMLAKEGNDELIVAHVDHGIRQESAADARFVEALSHCYGLQYEETRLELGSAASEETARNGRYTFLQSLAKKHGAVVATAHHRDDVVETIVINMMRGTGWRGLAALGSQEVVRPLRKFSKQQLYNYALQHGLEWVEDETNQTDAYLRNRVRRRTMNLPHDTRERLATLAREQRELAREIDSLAERFSTPSRYFMIMVEDAVASEVLRALLASKRLSLTRPQRQRLLHGIRTGRSGAVLEAGSGVTVSLTEREFIVKHP